MIFTVIGGGITIFLMAQSNLEIVLNNDTDKELSGLVLSYEGIKEDIEIPSIAAGKTEVASIDVKQQSDDDFSKAELLLIYTDDAGETHRETVMEQMEAGERADAEVTIEAIENDGKLKMDIQDITNLY